MDIGLGALLAGVLVGAIVMGAYMFIKRVFGESTDSDTPNSDVWTDELAGGGEKEPLTPEERILNFLHIERQCKRLPLEFSYLRSWSMLKDDALFWETLKKLEREGKVERVKNATESSDSMWTVPTPPAEELIVEELVAALPYEKGGGVPLNELQRAMKSRWEVEGDDFWNAFQRISEEGQIVCTEKAEPLSRKGDSLWALPKEEETDA